MKTKFKVSCIVALAAACLAGQARAADSASATQSSTATRSNLSDHFTSDYLGLYSGGALNALGSSYSPGRDGQPDPTTPQQLENYLGGYYKISEKTKVGVRAHFYYSPVENKNITMFDPLLQINSNDFYTRGNFKVSGYARAYLPLSNESTTPGRQFQLRFLINPSYDIPNSRYTIGIYSYAQPASFSSTSSKNTTFTGYVGPYLNYQMTRTVAITALYEMAATHNQTQDGLTNGGTDFEPGVNWDISPNLSINPYLNLYTGSKITADNTTINMLIIGKLF